MIDTRTERKPNENTFDLSKRIDHLCKPDNGTLGLSNEIGRFFLTKLTSARALCRLGRFERTDFIRWNSYFHKHGFKGNYSEVFAPRRVRARPEKRDSRELFASELIFFFFFLIKQRLRIFQHIAAVAVSFRNPFNFAPVVSLVSCQSCQRIGF